MDEQIKSIDQLSLNPESSTPSSMVRVMNQLKETEDRLYCTKKKLNKLQQRRSKLFNLSLQQEKRQTHLSEVREFTSQEKQRKRMDKGMRNHQLQQLKMKIQQNRQTQSANLKNFRINFLERNNLIYTSAKEERAKNDKKIKQLRERQIQKKKGLRDRMYAAEQKRKLKMSQYLITKHHIDILNKRSQHRAIQTKIKQKEEQIHCIESESRVVLSSLQQLMVSFKLKDKDSNRRTKDQSSDS